MAPLSALGGPVAGFHRAVPSTSLDKRFPIQLFDGMLAQGKK